METEKRFNRFSVQMIDSNDDHYLTREAPPRVDHYRHVLSIHGRVARPTLEELHVGHIPETYFKSQKKPELKVQKDGGVKFGWVEGVLVRCMLNIWGVMLFLRLSWMVGQAGIGLSCLIIIVATAVTVVTAISMCAICTNGEVKGGGTYYMISRSLGPEFGGSIGLIFALANAVAVAMYTIGFAEAFQDLLKLHSIKLLDGDLNDVRLIACLAVCLLLGIVFIGTQWESKAQMVLLVILLASITDFLLGSIIAPNQRQMSRGYIGWNFTLIKENFGPDFRGETFFSVFAVFFPSVTGILAGANISGDLKDPQKSIPLGSLLAIAITSASYLFFAFICGATVIRDANGLVPLFDNISSEDYISTLTNCSLLDNGCPYGLHHDFQVIELISVFGPLIYGGVFAATLSSALASLVSAPKIFQALCNDKLFPYIEYFGKGFGCNNEPRRGYVLAFIIAFGCCLIGRLNLIAPIISNFFLGAYALINFSCFHATLAKSPGFRPSFKYYNMWVSLLGSVGSLLVMFTGHWSVALLTFVVVLALYLYIMYRKPDVNWGSSTQAKSYVSAVSSVYKLNSIPFHVKNYRPQLLILSGNPVDRPALIDFGYSIVRKVGLVICGNVIDVRLTQRTREKLVDDSSAHLRRRHIKGFFTFVEENSFSSGVRSMVQSVGVGKLRPNVVLMGYKSEWLSCDRKDVLDYFTAIHYVFDNYLALAILRVRDGFDLSRFGNVSEILETMTSNSLLSVGVQNKSFVVSEVVKSESELTFSSLQSNGSDCSFPANNNQPSIYMTDMSDQCNPTNLLSADQFRRKQNKGFIDVWWLYDDGGLTLLLPYLLSTRKQWSDCKLRVFALATNENEIDAEKRQMIQLLSKFRINYSNVTIIPDVIKPPAEISLQLFDQIISKWIIRDSDQSTDRSVGVTQSEILALKEKTNRHIRLRELVTKHSSAAQLIVMTLPMPRKGTCSAAMYMSWLEVLTNDLPSFLLIRGNQTDVLTFYS